LLRVVLPILLAGCSRERPAVPVTAEQARTIALTHTPGAAIDVELEYERDTWVWEVELIAARQPNGPYIEIDIDPYTGVIIGVEEDWD
jgi:uncharacterized membrane protein YkoI